MHADDFIPILILLAGLGSKKSGMIFCSFSLKPDKFFIFLNYFFDLSYSAKYQTGRTAWTKNSKAFGVFSLLQTKRGRGSFDEAIGASRRMEERERDF